MNLTGNARSYEFSLECKMSTKLVKDLQRRKNIVCKTIHTDYIPEKSNMFVYKHESCSKKTTSKPKQVSKKFIKSLLEEYKEHGYTPLRGVDASLQKILMSQNINDHVEDVALQIQKMIILQCANDVFSEVDKTHFSKKSIKTLVHNWLQDHQLLPSKENESFTVNTCIVQVLSLLLLK